MDNANQDSSSSATLEQRLAKIKGAPLADTALIIVHVNEHYESVDCIGGDIEWLLEQNVAANVYEHSAQGESFLRNFFGLNWRSGEGKIPRYNGFPIGKTMYWIVDNETDPGEYLINPLASRRVIIAGGGVGNYCHGSATYKAVKQLLSMGNRAGIREVHLPADSIYWSGPVTFDGETELETHHIGGVEVLRQYEDVAFDKDANYIISVDGKVVRVNACFEKPLVHLALWSSSIPMVKYLREGGRVEMGEQFKEEK